MQAQKAEGTRDLIGAEMRAWQKMQQIAAGVFEPFGFKPIETPAIEQVDVFVHGIGQSTDVVRKEMFRVFSGANLERVFTEGTDTKLKPKQRLALRPEGTAGVVRAVVENNLVPQGSTPFKAYYAEAMFRGERPQKGRMRQFHQINCECLGPSEPYADAELVTMAMRFLEALGLKDLSLQLNSLGCPTCRPAYRETLRKWLSELDESALCEDCRRRMVTNPLRVLDCKVPSCREHTAEAPKILDHNCPDCAAHFETVRRLLDAEVVRGLDYYTRTTFEIVSDQIGAQGTVAGGGRYDGLVEQLGGPNVSGLGFACGMERLALLLPQPEAGADRPDFFTVVLTDVARDAAYALTQALRDAGFRGEMGFSSRSIKSAMRQAGKSGARFCLLIGEDELAAQTVMLKNMDSGEQSSVAFADVVARLQK